jgi:hypothetical protein
MPIPTFRQTATLKPDTHTSEPTTQTNAHTKRASNCLSHVPSSSPSMRHSQSPRAELNWTDPTCFQINPAESSGACHHCFESAPSCIPRLQPATRFHRRPSVSRVSSDQSHHRDPGNMTCAVLFASCAGCLRREVYCYGQKPSQATAIIHSATECISQFIRYKSGEMEWRRRGDVVTEVQEESVMNIQNRCCRRKDP